MTDRYTHREVAPINLSNSGRMDALLRAGRLYLSLQDAVALALENNLDIELQRYGPAPCGSRSFARQGGRRCTRSSHWHLARPASATSLSTGGGAGTGVAGAGGSSGGGTGSGANGATVLFTGTQVPSLDEVAFVNYSWVTEHRCSQTRC